MILPTVSLSLTSEIIFEPSPRQAAGRVHRKDENRFPVRSLTPLQAARNALAIAVQVDQTTLLNQSFQKVLLTMQVQRSIW